MRDETIVKYLEALKELKMILSYTDSMSMNEFCIKKGISKSAATVLRSGGIISNNGKGGKACRWYWTTSVEPNKQMSIENL